MAQAGGEHKSAHIVGLNASVTFGDGAGVAASERNALSDCFIASTGGNALSRFWCKCRASAERYRDSGNDGNTDIFHRRLDLV